MKTHTLLVFVTSFLLMSCASTKQIHSEGFICSDQSNFDVKLSAKVKNRFIFNDGKRSYRTFNLESNRFECIANEDKQEEINYDYAQTKKIYEAATELEKGQNDIKFYSAQLNGKSFIERTEEICKKTNLNYIFGTQLTQNQVFGCQATKNSKSAVMFRIDNDDDKSMTIATVAIYAPILQSAIN